MFFKSLFDNAMNFISYRCQYYLRGIVGRLIHWNKITDHLETNENLVITLVVNKVIKTLSLAFIFFNVLLKLLMLIPEKGKYYDMHFTAFPSD